MVRIKGVDVSYVQEGIDYKKLKAEGVKFAIIRLGYAQKEDVTARGHISNCQKYGIDYGFYWYTYAMSTEEAKAEAAACLKALKKYNRPSYPVYFDIEEKKQIDRLNTKTRTDMAVAFCEAIKKAGYPCGIYANPSWLEHYLDKTRILGIYDLWLAHWTDDPDRPTRYDYGQKLWQWGIDKIDGRAIDGDICFVDYPALTADFYKGQGQKAEPTKPASTGYKKGDAVKLSSASLYVSATAKNKANTLTGTYYIHSAEVVSGRIRITTPKGNSVVTGWVNVSDLNKTTAKKPTIKKGDTVRVKVGATTYTGRGLALFVYTRDHLVDEVKGDRAVISYDGDVVAAVNVTDLIKK